MVTNNGDGFEGNEQFLASFGFFIKRKRMFSLLMERVQISFVSFRGILFRLGSQNYKNNKNKFQK